MPVPPKPVVGLAHVTPLDTGFCRLTAPCAEPFLIFSSIPLLVRGDLLLASPLLLAEALPDQAFLEQKAREMLCRRVSPPWVLGTAASAAVVETELLQHSKVNK